MEHTNIKRVKPIFFNRNYRKRKTILLVGVGRSCTSLTAGVIDELGVPMDGSKDGHFERIDFKKGYIPYDEIKRLNKKHKVWGVQIATDSSFINELCQKLINPHIILVFRDIVANSQRLLTAELKDKLEAIEHVRFGHKEMFKIIVLKYPVMLLSCERIRYCRETIADLCNFIGVKEKKISRIGKNGGYLIQR